MNNYIIPLLIVFFVFTQCSATASKRSFGEVVDDNVIAMKLRSKYTKDKTVKLTQIDLKVWKGIVTLNGAVDSQEQIDHAIEIAEQQPGVKEVKAYLVLRELDESQKTSHKKWFLFSKKNKQDKTPDSEQLVEQDIPTQHKADLEDQNEMEYVKKTTKEKSTDRNDYQEFEY